MVSDSENGRPAPWWSALRKPGVLLFIGWGAPFGWVFFQQAQWHVAWLLPPWVTYYLGSPVCLLLGAGLGFLLGRKVQAVWDILSGRGRAKFLSFGAGLCLVSYAIQRWLDYPEPTWSVAMFLFAGAYGISMVVVFGFFGSADFQVGGRTVAWFLTQPVEKLDAGPGPEEEVREAEDRTGLSRTGLPFVFWAVAFAALASPWLYTAIRWGPLY